MTANSNEIRLLKCDQQVSGRLAFIIHNLHVPDQLKQTSWQKRRIPTDKLFQRKVCPENIKKKKKIAFISGQGCLKKKKKILIQIFNVEY